MSIAFANFSFHMIFVYGFGGMPVIFPKLDRGFRNTRDALNVLHTLKEKGVSVHSIDLGGDVTGNGVGAIIFTILSAFATFERERIASYENVIKGGCFLVPSFRFRSVWRDTNGARLLNQLV